MSILSKVNIESRLKINNDERQNKVDHAGIDLLVLEMDK
jgi:hypothetical protein